MFVAPAAASSRPLAVRLHWLEQRQAEHIWICAHGNHRWRRVRWHCAARSWTARELAEARSQWESRWDLWLPDKFARVGACETGYGKKPGNWHWDSGTYVSPFGIIRSAYNSFAHSLGYLGWDDLDPGTHQRHGLNAPPYEQYRVAAAIQARYGWGAWGCGGA